ncbi:BON domain-containing protein [Legionella sp. D16C41]|uniref:BON domain-containing protein n=1 Tax=Legionella sp. D16C41 TaxID=3402688 RepID=UPI003AF68A9D
MNLRSKWKLIVFFSCLTVLVFMNSSLAETTTEAKPLTNVDNKAMAPYDQSILESINTTLGKEAKRINIKVDNGIVYLSGKLNNFEEYERIVMLIESTLGVVDVNATALHVEGDPLLLNNVLLRAKIKGMLLQSGKLGKEVRTWPLHIEVHDGLVSLSGRVASLQEKQFIIDTVKSLEDVKEIVDKIEVNKLPAS